jgi:hypothetical protein
MKNEKIKIVVKTTRNAVETAIDLSKDRTEWDINEIWLWPGDMRFKKENKVS